MWISTQKNVPNDGYGIWLVQQKSVDTFLYDHLHVPPNYLWKTDTNQTNNDKNPLSYVLSRGKMTDGKITFCDQLQAIPNQWMFETNQVIMNVEFNIKLRLQLEADRWTGKWELVHSSCSICKVVVWRVNIEWQ